MSCLEDRTHVITEKTLLIVKTTIEGALLYTCRIEELGSTICISLNSALIQNPRLRDVHMVEMSGITPRSSDQQPETFIHINDTTTPEVVSEGRQSSHYVETISNFFIIRSKTNYMH